ncbi:hypothetical protein ABBQ38_001454 [Trebouxia sp. C0009 RCD-2024]
MLQQMLAAAVRGRRVPRKGFTALNSKRGPRTFYKGKGAESTGRHTRKGGYEMLKGKMPEFVVPNLKGFTLKPYVSREPTPKP